MEMKKKVFGIPIVLLVIGVLLIGGVSAALVNYLSNQVKVDVKVESPMKLSVSADGGEGTYSLGPYSADNVYGGETLTFYAKTKNMASAEIIGNIANIVTNADGLTCADFVSVVVTTTSTYEDAGDVQDRVIAGCTENSSTIYVCGPYDLIDLTLCSPINSTAVLFSYGPTPIDWAKKQIDVNGIVVTFKTNALGTYVFTNRVVPA